MDFWPPRLSTWQDAIPVTVVTGFLAALARWLRPRRLIGFLAAVKEREVLMAHADYERDSGLRWMRQAQSCQDEIERLDAEIVRLRQLVAQCID